ncbi:ABC transporter permease [Leptospira wolffii]|uniref:ABC transporter permease n=1 Tax=Leptospira wolffii TaxID=409998 RepID=UPI0002E6290D|nr:FtsX-like permease family protein [Leptospira wolffii]EPG66340.1 MacB-like periplasmic core domain protein [Leptospira wolffii serovar Khorat str. Khorat-H2]
MFFIALRQMSARKKQTILTLFGIVLGAAAYIVISGILLGLREYLVDQLVNNDAHVKISAQVKIIGEKDMDFILFDRKEIPLWSVPPSGRRDSAQIENQAGWLKKVSKDEEVEASSPQLQVKVIYRKGKISEAGRILGVKPELQAKVARIRENMISGDFIEIKESGNKLIIGEGLRLLLGARVNDTVYVSTGKTEPIPFKVVGAFQMGNKAVDDSSAYANLSDVQNLNQTPNRISDIAVRLKDVSRATPKAREWAKEGDVKIQSWEDVNATFISLFKMQDAIRYALVGTILLVAGFGIYNILNIVISQKRREIAILRSIGFEAGDILKIFLIQGLILGVAGGVIGMIMGNLICRRLEHVSFSNPLMQTKSGMMTVSFEPGIYLQAFLLAFIATLIASIFPARSASRLSPIEIIRGE